MDYCTVCGSKLKTNAKFCEQCGTAVASGQARRKRRASAQRLPWPLLAGVGGGIVLIGLALGLALSDGRSQPQVSSLPADEHSDEGLPYPTVQRITADEAFAMVQSGDALIVDVRDSESFAASHVAGALSLPEGELDTRIGELPTDQLIITYCT